MRIVVLDASVAVKWYVREQGSDQAVQLLDREDLHFVAPDLFRAEIANALLRQNRSGQLSEAALDSALADLTFTMPGGFQVPSPGGRIECTSVFGE